MHYLCNHIPWGVKLLVLSCSEDMETSVGGSLDVVVDW